MEYNHSNRVDEVPASQAVGRDGPRNIPDRSRSLTVAIALAALVVIWAAVNLTVEEAGFALRVSEQLQGGEEAVSAFARFFAALVIGLFLTAELGWRARWIAGGLVILGLGHLMFGYVEPAIQNDPLELNESLYEAFVTQTFACVLFAIALSPRDPSRFLSRIAIAVPCVLVAGYVVLFEFLEGDDWMPPMTHVDNLEDAVQFGASLGWLTPLHWSLALVPVTLSVVAAAGAFWRVRQGLSQRWLLLAMILLAGSFLHEYLWPSAYGGDILTTADALSLAFALVAAVGGIGELRRVASERSVLLAGERERSRKLNELAALRADFSAMVAHELDGPIAAIRRLNEMLSAEGADPDVREYGTGAIEGEADALNALVRDVRAAAAVERDDFEIHPRSLSVAEVLDETEAYARTLESGHSVTVRVGENLKGDESVYADVDRVRQVMRNLVSNAAKYSSEGLPIELHATRIGDRIRFEVADHGPGIHPDEMIRIFEKFGRGRGKDGRKVPGVGLGLYLSRRIVRSHGSELTVNSVPGEGSVFGFDLEVAR